MRTVPFPPSRGRRLLGLLFPGGCLICGKVSPGGPDLCPACQEALPESIFRRELGFPAAAPFRYREGVQKTLWRVKFRGERGWIDPLGRWMAGAAQELPAAGVVTWVPMSPAKRRRRGYDQSQLLAKAVGRTLDLPVRRLLLPLRETATQHELGRAERFANVKGAYAGLPDTAGQRVLLVDDILTTGATMMACAEALRAAGAAAVYGLTAAMDELDKEETP